MASSWEAHLERWVQAGLVPAPVASSIRAFEASRGPGGTTLRWPARLAVALGALLLGAAVLLFVAANWDVMSPGARVTLVLAAIGCLHAVAALAGPRLPGLATALHAAGTAALGGGIFLVAQVFHLAAHWPNGMLLWALGAWAGWWLLRDWPHVLAVALLTPAWLSGEWIESTRGYWDSGITGIMTPGWLLLSLVYLGAVGAGPATPGRRTLAWVGGLTVLPATAAVALAVVRWPEPGSGVPLLVPVAGWALALGLPLLLSAFLRGWAAWPLAVAAAWAVLLSVTAAATGDGADLAVHALCGAGALGLIGWGLREGRAERVNLGVAGFALTVLAYYYSSVLDKLGRSLSLAVLGVLFLGGGYLLERARRRLLVRMKAP